MQFTSGALAMFIFKQIKTNTSDYYLPVSFSSTIIIISLYYKKKNIYTYVLAVGILRRYDYWDKFNIKHLISPCLCDEQKAFWLWNKLKVLIFFFFLILREHDAGI